VVIPVMVVFEPAMRTVPVAAAKATAFMARSDPVRAGVRRTSPVALVPNIAAVCGVPVTINPDELRSRANRYDIMPRRWGRPNLNSDRDLGSRMMRAKQEH